MLSEVRNFQSPSRKKPAERAPAIVYLTMSPSQPKVFFFRISFSKWALVYADLAKYTLKLALRWAPHLGPISRLFAYQVTPCLAANLPLELPESDESEESEEFLSHSWRWNAAAAPPRCLLGRWRLGGVGGNLGPQSIIKSQPSGVQFLNSAANTTAFTEPKFQDRTFHRMVIRNFSFLELYSHNQQTNKKYLRLRYRLHQSRHGWLMICWTSLLQIWDIRPNAGDITALLGRYMQNLHVLLWNSRILPPQSHLWPCCPRGSRPSLALGEGFSVASRQQQTASDASSQH